jgi:hypothetical protein
LEAHPAWKAYAASAGAAYGRAEGRLVEPAREFGRREVRSDNKVLFYPFSGPDVVYAQAFFPEAERMVLVGLERVGKIPQPEAFSAEEMEGQMAQVARNSASLFHRSFFITSEMWRDMKTPVCEGVLPVALSLLARTGNTVDGARYVRIGRDGKLTGINGPSAKLNGDPEGFQVEFHRNGETKARMLYYFRADLGPGLAANPALLRFVDTLGAPDTLIKSASFLLHAAPFAALREYLRTHSRMVVQDDTGLRYQLLANGEWDLRLYGKYSRPDNPFRERFQPDLAEAYEAEGRAKPLGFAIGYGAARRPSHLVVALRKTGPRG